ncbi:MAG: hypothetical protein WB689_24810 [Xanthobacteraceae bacterium]
MARANGAAKHNKHGWQKTELPMPKQSAAQKSAAEEKKKEERRAREQRQLAEFLARFPSLPDDALAPDRFAAAVLGTTVWTLKRKNPVAERKISERVHGRRVGDIRALVRGEAVTA